MTFRRLFPLLAVVAFAPVALGQSEAPAPPPDENVERLAGDLRALARIAELAEKLENVRQVMVAIIDQDVDLLRGPREDGTYRWASLQRQEGSRVRDEKTIERVHSERELREVTVSAPNVYRVEVVVPRKRGVLAANNRVFVRNVRVDSTGFDGRTMQQTIPVNAWVSPGDSTGVPLPDIGRSVKATAELGVESGSRSAVAQVALVQAKLVDDPASPYFPAIRRLDQLRNIVERDSIDRGQLKSSVDEALLSLPGELEKRVAGQKAAEDRRRQLAMAGETKGKIEPGDATPDVLAAIEEIGRLLGGTLQEQTEARTKLTALVEELRPRPRPQP
ncbi:MAG TPA: hypothetical protein VNL91_11005 [Thermoanaerobaculia bacterium]|nr:hypothetical protein [Thermoanaerobaculia bacterium]